MCTRLVIVVEMVVFHLLFRYGYSLGFPQIGGGNGLDLALEIRRRLLEIVRRFYVIGPIGTTSCSRVLRVTGRAADSMGH